jgi:hypothetical protein
LSAISRVRRIGMNDNGRGKGEREDRIKSSILYLEVRAGPVIHHHSISRDAEDGGT